MPDIELPTYKNIVPNVIFEKEAKPMKHPVLGELSATQVTKLARFRAPTQDEIIEFIIINAKEIEARSLGSSIHLNSNSSIPVLDNYSTVYFLKSLPSFVIEDISKGNPEILNPLRGHCHDYNSQADREYLMSSNKILLNVVLNSLKELNLNRGAKFYDQAIGATPGEEWTLRIRLLENRAFPDKSELEYLIERGVRDSDVFTVLNCFENYQDTADQIRTLYKTLVSPEIITQLKDKSSQFLEQRAILTIKELIECAAESITTDKNIRELSISSVKSIPNNSGVQGKQKTPEDKREPAGYL